MAKKIGRPFAVFDIDGTLIRWQLYHAIADSLVKLGFIAPVKFQAIKDARMAWKRREDSESFKRYEQKLVKLYGGIMNEITPEQFDKTAEAVFNEYKDQVYTYTRALIEELKAAGYLLFAISGSQTEIVSKIAAHYGFDDYIGSTYIQKNGHYTGAAKLPFLHKDVALRKMIEKHQAVLAESLAVGDSLSDIKMLEMVEVPITFNPERQLFDYAERKGWRIVIERKNMVYELRNDGRGYELVTTDTG
jgi:HAD superfamily hydrolase (TIGR01490 family)